MGPNSGDDCTTGESIFLLVSSEFGEVFQYKGAMNSVYDWGVSWTPTAPGPYKWIELIVVFKYYEAKETYSRIWVLRG